MPLPRVGIGLALCAEDHDFKAAPAYRFEYLKQHYYEALESQGLLCFGLPASERVDRAADYADAISGLLLSGGEDINPAVYDAELDSRTHALPPRRDNFELALIRECRQRGIPILGICRGLQLLNVACGGTLWQDLSDLESSADHRQRGELDFSTRHQVGIVAGSRLHQIIGARQIETNTGHHQGVNVVGEGLQVAARSVDGVVEALEGEGFLLGVQWHP
ncbi:MAG: gamma-glutamyl-gamma-aminobutyrate hydrolase family protein, partial [bacterium]